MDTARIEEPQTVKSAYLLSALKSGMVALAIALTATLAEADPRNDPRNQIVIEPPYDAYEHAAMLIGLDEVRDREELKNLFRSTIGYVDPVATPWCAGFIDAMLIRSGKKPLGTLWARDFLKYGIPVSQPQKGDLVVLTRGPVYGHVGFFHRFVQTNQGLYVAVLGGNNETRTDQGSVSVGYFPIDRVLGYRRIS
jgi:uncharacterized protein (TIGR02594 family)